MALLLQTTRAIDKLLQAGFARREFSVQSPPSMILHGKRCQGTSLVNFKDGTEKRQLALAPRLSPLMKVVLYHSEGDLRCIQVRPYEGTGLYLWLAGKEIEVESIEIAHQLAQWDDEQFQTKEQERAVLLVDYHNYMEP